MQEDDQLQALQPHAGGPYVQAATFCEMVIQDQGGVLSLISLIDTLNQQAMGPQPPKDMPPFQRPLKLVVMLKSGMARGGHEVRMTPVLPSGEMNPPFTSTIYFEGEERGTNLVMDLSNFMFQYEGLYWFDIHLNQLLLTRVPLRVKYHRILMNPPRLQP